MGVTSEMKLGNAIGNEGSASKLVEHLSRTAHVKQPQDAGKSLKIAELEVENKDTNPKVDVLERKIVRLMSRSSPEAAESSDEVVPTPTTSDSEINDAEAIQDLREIANPNPKEKVTLDLTGDSDSD